MAATSRRGATSGLRIRLVLLNPSLRLQIDRVQRQGRSRRTRRSPGTQGNVPTSQSTPAPNPSPTATPGEEQERHRLGRSGRTTAAALVVRLRVIPASHYTCREKGLQRGVRSAVPNAGDGPRPGDALTHDAALLSRSPPELLPTPGASGSGRPRRRAAVPAEQPRHVRGGDDRGDAEGDDRRQNRCCVAIARPLRQMHQRVEQQHALALREAVHEHEVVVHVVLARASRRARRGASAATR